MKRGGSSREGSGHMTQNSDVGVINALWDADRKGYSRPLREAVKAAREFGMTDEQIAGELMTKVAKVAELAAE
jgi:hypothetical protein